jgi:hypothetical protein
VIDESLIETIQKIKDKKYKVELVLLFIEELGGTLTHLKNAGLSWGAAGEAYRAAIEHRRIKKIVEKLKNIILENF